MHRWSQLVSGSVGGEQMSLQVSSEGVDRWHFLTVSGELLQMREVVELKAWVANTVVCWLGQQLAV